jgi:prefoldin subunit 5
MGDRLKRSITRYEKFKTSSSKSIQIKDERIRTLEKEKEQLRDEVKEYLKRIEELEAERGAIKREKRY